MFIVYIKHYLTDIGMSYFIEQWFPKIKSISCQQKGFVAIRYYTDSYASNCISIILKFIDEDSLNAWANQEDHECLINELDIYRSGNY